MSEEYPGSKTVFGGVMPKKQTLMLMSPEALRAHAAKFFVLGFRLSGHGLNGEVYDEKKSPALKQLLLAEFNRVYDEAGPRSRQDSGDEPRGTRPASRSIPRR